MTWKAAIISICNGIHSSSTAILSASTMAIRSWFPPEDDPVRFLLISGKPIGEPVAWYGPIVMNTNEELRIAFEEYNNGTFVRQKTVKK